MKTCVIVLAGGRGARMGTVLNKHLSPLSGRPLIEHTLLAFERHASIQAIVLVALEELLPTYAALVANAACTKVIAIVPGGRTRQESCYRGLQVAQEADIVLVHDGARPLVSSDVIGAVIQSAVGFGAATVAAPVKDTIKRATDELLVGETLDRTQLWQAQTPQGFRIGLFWQAHEHARQIGFDATDDVGLVEKLGIPVKLVAGDYRNIKVTTPEDLIIAETLLKVANSSTQPETATVEFRVGLGQDSHKFAEANVSKPLLLGGVRFDHEPALEAESDGDVILHAVFNALSQAVGGRSLGYYSDPLFREQGITDSRRYLEIGLQLVREKHYMITNLGVSIECRRPRIEPHADEIKQSLASLLGIAQDQVSITATSGEGLTAFGRGEGIQVFVIVGLVREKMAR